MEAVSLAIRSSPYLRGHYRHTDTRCGSKDAKTATTKKLAELAGRVWTEHRAYEEP